MFESALRNLREIANRRLFFQRMMSRYHIQDPEEMTKARNRYQGFQVDINDFAVEDHFQAAVDDGELLQRISRSYVLSKGEQPKYPDPYSVYGMWEQLLSSDYGEMTAAAAASDISGLNAVCSNIFRKRSRGLSMSGATPDFRDAAACELHINDYVDYLLHMSTYLNFPGPAMDMDSEGYIFTEKIKPQELWKAICKKAGTDAAYPAVGNPFGLKLDTESGPSVVPQVAVRHLHAALRIRQLVAGQNHACILEIGGGFGGIQYYVAKTVGKPFVIYSLDIPEINIISAYFLSRALPEVNVVLYGEEATGTQAKGQQPGGTIFILPNWKLKELAENSVDVAVNTDSLPEVPEAAMKEYLHSIARISKYFYSVNHDCGRGGQNRLSQLNPGDFGLRLESYNISWIRHGYFERVYSSINNVIAAPEESHIK